MDSAVNIAMIRVGSVRLRARSAKWRVRFGAGRMARPSGQRERGNNYPLLRVFLKTGCADGALREAKFGAIVAFG